MSIARPVVTGIIDVHSHALLPIWLEAIQKLFRSEIPFTIAGAPVPEWTVQGHLAVMETNGIATSILSWPGAVGFFKGKEARNLARAMNEQFAEIISQNPTRFGAFAVLPMDDIDAALEEMAYALDVLKLDGVSSGTHADGHYLGHAYFDPLFAEMHRRSTTLFVHPTVPPGFNLAASELNVAILEFMFETTRMATNLVVTGAKARYDKINIICTHGGGTIPYLAPRIGILEPIFGAGPGRRILSSQEISDGLSSFYFDLTAATRPASLDAIRHLVPTTKLLMGFDYPMMPETEIAPAKAAFDSYEFFTDADRDIISHGNAKKLFPRLQVGPA